MNKIDWLDHCFSMSGISIEEYLQAKDLAPIEPQSQMCSAKEAIEFLNISRSQFFKLKKLRKIPYVHGFGEDRYRYDLLKEMVEKRTINKIQ